jgi:hypothetical protein
MGFVYALNKIHGTWDSHSVSNPCEYGHGFCEMCVAVWLITVLSQIVMHTQLNLPGILPNTLLGRCFRMW